MGVNASGHAHRQRRGRQSEKGKTDRRFLEHGCLDARTPAEGSRWRATKHSVNGQEAPCGRSWSGDSIGLAMGADNQRREERMQEFAIDMVSRKAVVCDVPGA